MEDFLPMKKLQVKSYIGEIADIDSEKRRVKAVWAKTGNVDRDSDIIVEGAFTKTIAENGPNGKNEIWSLVDHCTSFKYALGKPEELYMEGANLVAITPIIDTEMGEDMLKMYIAGVINQHSIGFSTIRSDWQDQKQEVRLIKEVKLYEGSAVLWGANPETPTLDIMKSFSFDEIEENGTLFERLEKLPTLMKALSTGNFTDNTFYLLERHIKQIKEEIESTYAAAQKAAPTPQNDEILNALKQFNSQF